MTIRKAKIKDVPNLVQLAMELLKYHESFDPYFAPAKNAKDVYAKFFKRCIYSTIKQLLVAEYNGEIAGYALGEISSRPPVFKIRNIGAINDMFVAEKFRKSGVAKQLLTELLDWIKRRFQEFSATSLLNTSCGLW